MSNENLNDFYNQNRFNQKLRERIDGYEPELSDSLWDRIEHDLVRKESKGKRAVWMVYLLAGLLLVSGAGIYYLANENHKLAEKVKDNTQNTETLKGKESPSTVYQLPETTVEVELAANEATESSTEPSQTAIAAVSPAASSNTIETTVQAAPSMSEALPIQNIDMMEDIIEAPSYNTPLPTPAATPDALTISGKELKPFALASKTRFVNPIQENIINKGAIDPRITPYVGISSDLGSTRQLVSGPMAWQFGQEHPLIYKSNGLNVGVLFRNGLSLESGLRITLTGSDLWYDFKVRASRDTLPIGAIADSIVSGSRHNVNRQNWTDIPLLVGYRYRLNQHWSLNGQTGLTYSMINGFSGVEPTQSFSKMDIAGSSVAQPFKNYLSLNLGVGIGYQLGRHWMIDLQGNYRRGLTKINASNLPNHPDRIVEVVNARLGIKYLIR